MENEKTTKPEKESAGSCPPAMTGYVSDLKDRWKLDEDNPAPDATGLSNKELGILEMAREDIKECVKIIETALAEAVGVIYFNDERFYHSAIWRIIKLIDLKAAELLEKDEREAYKIYVESSYFIQLTP